MRPELRMLVVVVMLCLALCVPAAADEAAEKPAAGDAAAERFRELRNLYRADPAKAAEGFREFVTTFPDSDLADDAQYWLGLSLDESRAKPRDIVAAYQTLIDKYPDSNYHDDACFAVAEVWRRHGRRSEDFNEAIKSYLNFIEKCPKSARVSEAKLKVGELYGRIGEPEKAAVFFRRVVEEHPESSFASLAQVQLARIELRLGRTDEALEIYARLLETGLPDKERIGVRLGMVDCYLSLKDPADGLKKALETCDDIRREAREKKILEDYAEYKTREKMASFYLRGRKHAEAEAEYQAYIARFGTSVGVWQARLNIGTIRLAAGRSAEAREMFQAVTSQHPPGADERVPWYVLQAMYYEANTYELEKNVSEARRLYQKLVDHYPRTSEGRRAREKLEKLEKQAGQPVPAEKK